MEGSSHKRRHEDRDDSEIGPQRKAKRVEAAERRPKARDFEVDVQDVISAAIAHYRTELSTKNAYPDMTTEVNWARAAWKAGCHDKDVEITPNSDVLRLVSNITTSFTHIWPENLCRLQHALLTFAEM